MGEPITTMSNRIPISKSEAANAGLRWHQLQNFSAEVTGRAWIGSPLRQRSRSSATISAEPYRRSGALLRHFRQMLSRSPGTWGLRARGDGASSEVIRRINSNPEEPANGVARVSIS